jgi:hypothetical protein
MTRCNRLMFEPSAYLAAETRVAKKDYFDWLEDDLVEAAEKIDALIKRQ